MAWRARQRSENKRAGGLKGRDRGWLPGSSQANTIGIPHNLVNKTREKTTTLVTKEAAANIAGGPLSEPLPYTCDDGNIILIDTKCLVVNTNQLGGIGRFRSQFNVDADGIKQARYYLPQVPKGFVSEKCTCQRVGCFICINNLRTLNIFFPNMFGPPGSIVDPENYPVRDNNGNIIGYTYTMLQDADFYGNYVPGFNVTPHWYDTDNYIYPVSFNNPGGKITFDYNNTGLNNNEIKFKFEHYGYNDCGDGGSIACTEPYFFTYSVELPANSAGSKIINIPTQGSNEYNNIIFYLTYQGVIDITNIKLTSDLR